MASIFSPLPPLPPCSCPFLSLRPQLLLPLFLSVYLVPGGWAVLFFCRSSGRKAKESPRQPSVYKAFCHVNKDKPLLSLTSLIPNSSVAVHPVSLDGRLCVPAIASSVCTRLRACECACLRVCVDRLAWSPASSPGIIDLTNCRPCFILRKWQEQSGETEPGD